jgi:hypothetical protein
MSQVAFSATAAQSVLRADAGVNTQAVPSQPVELSLEALLKVGGGAQVDSPKHGW